MINILEFDSVELSFDDRRILSGIYMKCETGRVVGLLGRNGSGKSSLMKIIFGTLKPDFQSVRLNGKHLPGNGDRHHVITYLPQDSFIPNRFTIREVLQLYKVDQDEIFVDFPDFEPMFNLKAQQMSAGMLRIFEVMLILKTRSMFSFLDEPFSGIMPVHVEKLQKVISREKENKGIVISDHLYRHVTAICDQLYVLANGQTYGIKNHEELVKYGYLSTVE